MFAKTKRNIELEIAHLPFIEAVGSLLAMTNEQRAVLEALNAIAQGPPNFSTAGSVGEQVSSPARQRNP